MWIVGIVVYIKRQGQESEVSTSGGYLVIAF